MTGKILKKLPISSGEANVAVNGWELGEGMFLYTLIVNGREIDTFLSRPLVKKYRRLVKTLRPLALTFGTEPLGHVVDAGQLVAVG